MDNKNKPLTPGIINQALATGSSSGSAKSRLAVKTLLRTTRSVGDRVELLTVVRQKNDAPLRRQVVRAFLEAGYHADLITGASVMTRHDATLFYKDYFALGGKLEHVTEWLGEISKRYVREKRRGHIDPDYDGFWDNAWDEVVGTVDTIADAVATTVKAVIDAGKDFSELVGDIVNNAQRRINEIVEALLDAGEKVGELISGAIEGAIGAISSTLQKIVAAILAAGKTVLDLVSAFWSSAREYLQDGIKALITLGVRIRDILKAGIDLALDTLGDIVGILVDLGHSVWYILQRIAAQSFDVLKTVMQKLLQVGKTILDLVEWCARRSFNIMKKGLSVLLALGYAASEIVKCILRNPTHLSNVFRALKELGVTIYDFLRAGADLGIEFLKRAYGALLDLGITMAAILAYAATTGFGIFVETVKWLVLVNVKFLDILLWSTNQAIEIFGWVMEAADALFESFLDILVWAFSFGGTAIERLAAHLAEKAKGALAWFKDKVLLPVVTVGKVYLLVALAVAHIAFIAITYQAFGTYCADPARRDYLNWPNAFEDFKNVFADKMALLPLTPTTGYVIFSDAHKESKEDVKGGIGHFYKNKELLKAVLQQYSQNGTWTVITLGDDEDFWMTYDLLDEGDPVEKVEPIIAQNSDVFEVCSNDFYTRTTPRKFIKICGNHDDVWKRPEALSRLQKHGFPNIEVYDFAVISGRPKDILLMHGHQYDSNNCDANNAFGKFITNCGGVPLDKLNDVLVSIFGAEANLEQWKAVRSVFNVYTRTEWPDAMKDPAKLDNPAGVEDRGCLFRTMKNYNCSMIIGHTHVPRLLKDQRDTDQELFYANTGTCAYWEGCVWTVEVTLQDVALKAWVADNSGNPSLWKGWSVSVPPQPDMEGAGSV